MYDQKRLKMNEIIKNYIKEVKGAPRTSLVATAYLLSFMINILCIVIHDANEPPYYDLTRAIMVIVLILKFWNELGTSTHMINIIITNVISVVISVVISAIAQYFGLCVPMAGNRMATCGAPIANAITLMTLI